MTLRGADLRFVLPHSVERALVLGARQPQLQAIAAGFRDAGIEVVEELGAHRTPRPDLVVAPGAEAVQALEVPARAHLLIGGQATGLRDPGMNRLPLLLRGAPHAPRLIVPLVPKTGLQHLLRTASPAGRVARGLTKTAAAVTRLPLPARTLVPSRALATLVMPRRSAPPLPAILQAATALGVDADGGWFLRLGDGDVLQRAVFMVLDGPEPTHVVKFSRVTGYDRSFVGDAAGLALARAAGGPVTEHAPVHLGRLDVGGLTASVETAAVGTQLSHLLPRRPWQLLDAIAGWIGDVARHTAQSGATLEPERVRMRKVVSEVGVPLGAPADVVDRVPQVPAVLQHNDLGSWNIISDGRAFTVVDWESARHPGFPLWDLFYFAADVLAQVDGPTDASSRIERTIQVFAGESAHSARLFGWVRAASLTLGVPDSSLGALASLCWIHHGQSAARRSLDLMGAAPAPLGHIALLGRTWLKHPKLGVSWNALCD